MDRRNMVSPGAIDGTNLSQKSDCPKERRRPSDDVVYCSLQSLAATSDGEGLRVALEAQRRAVQGLSAAQRKARPVGLFCNVWYGCVE